MRSVRAFERGYQEDNRRIPRGYQEDTKRIPRGYQENTRRYQNRLGNCRLSELQSYFLLEMLLKVQSRLESRPTLSRDSQPGSQPESGSEQHFFSNSAHQISSQIMAPWWDQWCCKFARVWTSNFGSSKFELPRNRRKFAGKRSGKRKWTNMSGLNLCQRGLIMRDIRLRSTKRWTDRLGVQSLNFRLALGFKLPFGLCLVGVQATFIAFQRRSSALRRRSGRRDAVKSGPDGSSNVANASTWRRT